VSEPNHRPASTLHGYAAMTQVLRVELGDPDLPISRVASWGRFRKLPVRYFGRIATITTDELINAARGLKP
jgi:hypothetical protein